MVRLVFRPYTQVRRTICTSVSLRASIRVSSDFALLRHSSPSFGSQQICSYSHCAQTAQSVEHAPQKGSVLSRPDRLPSLSLRVRVCHPNTRIYVRLLGPCFKTGRNEQFCQNREQLRWASTPVNRTHIKHSFAIRDTRQLRAQSTTAPKGECCHNA